MPGRAILAQLMKKSNQAEGLNSISSPALSQGPPRGRTAWGFRLICRCPWNRGEHGVPGSVWS